MLRKLHLVFFLFLGFSTYLSAQPCECTNCPVPIQDNGTFQGLLNVTVDGPNNLALCPLQQVCFTITHTWIGDLAVTLTSPSGQNYMVMADANNNSGGCGNSSNNIDVCVTVGTGNPLTNNTEYNCNGGNPCLVGNWTAPCGGVSDPITGAVQAPGCDLNAFNFPGAPANGTWTLTVNDICAQDVGFLDTWSLVFACGVEDCITCEPDGGALNQADVTSCFGDPELNLNIQPDYNPPSSQPDPADYDYTFVLVQNGIITGFVNGPNLSNYPPGTYQVCGLSFAAVDAGDYLVYLGQPYVLLQNALQNGSAPFCGDLSDDCFEVIIGPVIQPTVTSATICFGDCITTPVGQCCNPGPCQYTVPSYLGCDSTTIINIIMIPPTIEVQNQTVCPGECVVIDGTEYCPPGSFPFQYVNQQGCDSIVTLNLFAVPVNAVANAIGSITCQTPAAQLTSVGSIGSQIQWINPNNQPISTQPTITVTQAGCYTLNVTGTLNGVSCTDTAVVCITADLNPPAAPVLTGNANPCTGDTAVYTIGSVPGATDYDWTEPPGTTIIAGGDGDTTITLDLGGFAGGDLCVAAVNGCGPSQPACLPITVEPLPGAIVLSGDDSVCPNEIADYFATVDPDTDTYTWTVPVGATITAGQGTAQITVDWGASAGGDVCMTPSNACGDGPQICFAVAAGLLPADPIVAGLTSVCSGVQEIYSTPADPNATGFSWVVPACATLVSGQGTNSILVEWTAPCAGGDICVAAVNGCGASAQICYPVVVTFIPAAPTVSGETDPCAGDTETYTVPNVPGNTGYTWTVTGGTILSGQGTTAIQVVWGPVGSGEVCANVSNVCGASPDFCLPVNIQLLPIAPVLSGPTVVCDGSVSVYSSPADPAATGYTWTVSCGAITAGQNTPSITVDWTGCPGGGQVCLTVESNCGPSAQVCQVIQGGTIPADPILSGPDTPCEGSTQTYCVTADPNASGYVWTLTGGTILSGQGTDCVDVQWDASGAQQVCAVAQNGCGDSGQTCFLVEVATVPAAPALDGENQPCINSTQIYTVTSSDPTATGFTWSATCGLILSGQGTNSAEILWDQSGACQVCVTADNTCGSSVQTCLDVAVIDFPVPDAGPDGAVCGLSFTLQAVAPASGAGMWTASGPGTALFSDPADPNATVTVDAYGPYTFTWEETVVTCSASDQTIVSFNPDPVLTGAILETCDAGGQFYTVTFTLSGGQSPYSVTGAIGGSLLGDVFTSDPVPSGTPYTFEVFDNLGCGPLTISGQETCNCVTDAGDMDLTLAEACETDLISIQAPPNAVFDPNDAFVFVLHTDNGTNGSTLGTILAENTTGEFTFLPGQMNFNETYFVSYVVGNPLGMSIDLSDDCTDIAQGQPVVFYENPQPNAGADIATCGLVLNELSALPGVGLGAWSQVAGPGTAFFFNPNDPISGVSADQFGVYTFVWTEDNNGCIASDQMLVTFLDGPQVAVDPTFTCDLINFTYEITFDIIGGTPPYTVTGGNGGTVTGATFVSNPVPSATPFLFEITDANGCGPFDVQGTYECFCTTFAGDMDLNTASFCVDELAVVPASINGFLDPEDILLYVLHDGSGNALGAQVFGYNTAPEFAFVPPMQTGVTYYISPIAGNDLDLDGIIDSNDPCWSITAGTPVVFTALPQASFAADITVCEGDLATLSLTVDAQTLVDIDYITSEGASGTLTGVQTGDILTLTAGVSSFTVTITGITDQNGCQGAGGNSATVTVNTIPTATVTAAATVCNSTDSGNPTTLDFDALVTAGDLSGSWANTSGVAVGGTFPLLDFAGVAPGVYTFTYTTGSALPPCPNTSNSVQVTVEDCVCPDLSLIPLPALCNDAGTVDLSDAQVFALTGAWAITGTPSGAVNLPVLNGDILSAVGADPGVYELTFTLTTPPPVGCPNSNTLEIAVSESLTAGAAGSALEFCAGSSELVQLASLLIGADSGGTWTEVSATPSTGGAFNAAAGTFQISGQAAQSYIFRYSVTPADPCPADFAEVTVTIYPLPQADAGADALITCDEPTAQLGGNSTIGTGIAYNWTWDGGAFPGNAGLAQPEVGQAGIYTLLVTNTLTGCAATDQMTVTASQETPVPFLSIQPVSCFGKEDGVITVDSIVGGVPPYLVSLNGGPFTSSTVFANLAPDTYTLVVEDANGCQNEPLSINIEQPQELNVTLVAILEADNSIRLGDSVDLQALINIPESDVDSILWTPSDLVSCDTCLIVTAGPLQTTTFSVYVESNGCSDSDALRITVRNEGIYAPNAFSPNGDGDNDVFLLFAGPEVRVIKRFLVFNRWGETVHSYLNFQPNDPVFGWDGTFRGQPLDPAVFTWFAEVEFKDGRLEIYKGDVTLVK